MFIKRTLVILLLLPVTIALVWQGGWWLTVAWALTMAIAGWEYTRMFNHAGYQPWLPGLIAGIAGVVTARHIAGLELSAAVLAAFVFAGVIYHVIQYEGGNDKAGTNFTITVAGLVYIGWLGAFLISLRDLPSGLWWVLLTLISVWMADFGGYAFGVLLGRHKISKRVSPKKSWEGYLGGIVLSVIAAWIFFYYTHTIDRNITLTLCLWTAGLIAVLTIFGDLGESMLKRQTGVKDSGSLLPGHGGVFDRVDSWLWASVIGYYLIKWMLH